MRDYELQNLINWVSVNAKPHEVVGHDDGVLYVNELLKLLSNYPIEESKACCAPNYEAMYNEQLGLSQDLLKKNKELKNENRILEHKLACAKGAIAMVEVIYGRQWAPCKLEMIR